MSVLLNNLKIQWANKSFTSAVASFIEALPTMSNCKLKKKKVSLNLLLDALNL
jgi:hypothetical protein